MASKLLGINDKQYICDARLLERKFKELLKLFCADLAALTAGKLTLVNRFVVMNAMMLVTAQDEAVVSLSLGEHLSLDDRLQLCLGASDARLGELILRWFSADIAAAMAIGAWRRSWPSGA